tara:strand:- start:4113 stop:4454 length:342 start_codon:yes stop_codon:yes gene_type:complete
MNGGAKKKFKIVKIEKGAMSKSDEKLILNKVFLNKDSFNAAKKASNALLKHSPKKTMIKFILENQKINKNGVKKQLAYTAQRDNKEKTIVINGKEVQFRGAAKVKSCLRTDVK